MNKKQLLLTGAVTTMAALSLCSCKQKPQSEDIIVEKVIEKPQEESSALPGKQSSGDVKWVNDGIYTYSISIAPDSDLPEVSFQDHTYKDNSATLTVKRSDGTEFFSNRFTKNSFTGLLSQKIKDNGVLLGLAYDHADADNLYFVASIGSPDETSEEFSLVMLILNRMGTTSVSTYTPDEIPE